MINHRQLHFTLFVLLGLSTTAVAARKLRGSQDSLARGLGDTISTVEGGDSIEKPVTVDTSGGGGSDSTGGTGGGSDTTGSSGGGSDTVGDGGDGEEQEQEPGFGDGSIFDGNEDGDY